MRYRSELERYKTDSALADERCKQAQQDAASLRADLRQQESIESDLRCQLRKAKNEAEEVSIELYVIILSSVNLSSIHVVRNFVYCSIVLRKAIVRNFDKLCSTLCFTVHDLNVPKDARM